MAIQINDDHVYALEVLGQNAKPTSDEDFGSERQVQAQNAFFEVVEAFGLLTPELEDWCMKATTEEMVDRAIELARDKLYELPDGPSGTV